MVYHFGSQSPELTLELLDKKVVKFQAKSFVTDNGDVADKIKATNMFKTGQIYLVDSSIAGANAPTRPKVVSGARGTDDNDLVSNLQSQLEAANAKIEELKKPRPRGRPKKSE